MKILHVYKTFLGHSFGGVEQVISQIAMTQNPRLFEHTVVSLSKQANRSENASSRSAIQTICYPESVNIASNAMSWSLLKDFGRLAEAYDLIHYHFPWPFADIMHSLWQIKKPSVVTYHSDIVRQKHILKLYQPLMHYFLKSAQHIVATSPQYAASSEVLQRYQDKVRVIPIGLNKAHYPVPTLEREMYWREKYGASFFLFVGVMRYYKGLDVLLDAIQGATFPVVLVGTGPLEQALKAKASALQLSNVHFLGELPELDKTILLQLCRCVVFPSHLRSEAFGVSLLEGAMFGKPMISAEIGTGTSYINRHETTGLVVPPNDAKALRVAMDFIWDNEERAQFFGQQASKRYDDLFTGDQMVSQYEALYTSIV